MNSILANHLLFIRRHRGDYFATDSAIYITSEAPGFTSWTPLSSAAVRPPEFDAVRLVPGSGEQWPDGLHQAGFSLAEQLSYQDFDLTRSLEQRPVSDEARITRGQSEKDACAFAEVQAVGFLDGPGEATDWWTRFFRFVALRNIHDPIQDFLIAAVDERAVAVLLLVTAGETSGVYAVATRPDARGRGLSTSLLLEAARRARARNSKRLVLQALCGSYADGFYRRLGFTERYVTPIWRRSTRS